MLAVIVRMKNEIKELNILAHLVTTAPSLLDNNQQQWNEKHVPKKVWAQGGDSHMKWAWILVGNF